MAAITAKTTMAIHLDEITTTLIIEVSGMLQVHGMGLLPNLFGITHVGSLAAPTLVCWTLAPGAPPVQRSSTRLHSVLTALMAHNPFHPLQALRCSNIKILIRGSPTVVPPII